MKIRMIKSRGKKRFQEPTESCKEFVGGESARK